MSDLLDDIETVEPERGTRGNSFGRLLEEKMTKGDELLLRELAVTMNIPFAEDVIIALIRNARPSANGHAPKLVKSGTHQVACDGCGNVFPSNRRKLPGKKRWCDDCRAKGEPAADRARRFRERRSAK